MTAALDAKANSSSLSAKADMSNPVFTGTTTTFVSGTINGSAIAAGTINGSAIIGGTIQAGKLATGSIQNSDINDSVIAQSKIINLSGSLAAKADLASPPFTGTVSAPTISITSGTAVTTTTSTGALQVSGGVGISGNVNIGGNIFLKTGSSVYVDGTVLSTGGGGGGTGQNKYPVDFTSKASSSYYYIEIQAPTPALGTNVYQPITFTITGSDSTATGSTAVYNDVTIIGTIRTPNNTDHNLYYDFTQVGNPDNDRRFLGIYYEYVATYPNIVIYAIGGYKYTVLTNGVVANYSGTPMGLTNGTTTFPDSLNAIAPYGSTGGPASLSTNARLVSNKLLNDAQYLNKRITNMGTLIDSGTTSDSNYTGALVVSGGVGIGGAVNIGNSLTVGNGLTVTAGTVTLPLNSIDMNEINSEINFSTSGTIVTTNTISCSANVQSTSTGTGTLKVTGGAGITGHLYVGGNLMVTTGDVNAVSYNATSDFRIKKNITGMSGQSSLESFRNLKPSEYKLIERPDKSKVYGFIAQEIMQTIPESVIIGTGFVPSIYEMAFINDDKKKITLINKTTAKAWQKIKISDEPYDVTDIIDDKTFRIKTEINKDKIELVDVSGAKLTLSDGVHRYKDTDEVYNGIVRDGVFVYGPQVDDFHSLNKDMIWTVTTRATQELDKQLQDARQRITTLENQVFELMEFMKNTNK